jgi:hypothetical protein
MSGPSQTQPAAETTGGVVGDWDRDLTPTSEINEGEVVAVRGALMRAETDRDKGTEPNWQKQHNGTGNENNQDFLRLTNPYVPRNLTAMIHGARGTSGRGSRKSRYQKPTPTGSRLAILNLTTSSPSQYRFHWDTDVRVNLPTNAAYPGDLNILDARSVTLIGGKLTATGASAASGGFIRCGNIMEFVWLEGLHCDLVGRVKSVSDGGGPDQHDAMNLAGKTRSGSTSGHVVGDTQTKYQHTEVIGGVTTTVSNLDHDGEVIETKWNDDPDYTRHSHPDLYIISCRVDGVQGQESGGVHGDILQYQGSVGSVYIDMLTGTSQYQGLQSASTQGVTGVYCRSRINLKGYSPTADANPESAFLYWDSNGGADRELPLLFNAEVYAGPSYNSDGTLKTLFELVHPNETFHLTGGTREGLKTGWRDMGYVCHPHLGLNVSATGNVLTTLTFNTDGVTTANVNHGFAAGDQVVFSRGTDATKTGSPSGGITWETVAYYVVNPSGPNFQIAATAGGTPLTITDFAGGVFANPTYVFRKRSYIAPSPAMPYQGFVYEGLPSDVDWVTPSQCGIGYVSAGSQWDPPAADTTPPVIPLVTWDGVTGTQPPRPAVPSGQVVIWAQPTSPFTPGPAVTGDFWLGNTSG